MERRIALMSTDDKSMLGRIATTLHEAGYTLISSGGTRKRIIDEAKLDVTDVAEWTGFPPMLDHRLVTIHPRVAGGMLAMPDRESHVRDMKEFGFEMVDFVYFGLYDYQRRLEEHGRSWGSCLEHMDVGGPMALRAATKGERIVVTNPHDALDAALLLRDKGAIPREEARRLQLKALMVAHEQDGMAIAELSQLK